MTRHNLNSQGRTCLRWSVWLVVALVLSICSVEYVFAQDEEEDDRRVFSGKTAFFYRVREIQVTSDSSGFSQILTIELTSAKPKTRSLVKDLMRVWRLEVEKICKGKHRGRPNPVEVGNLDQPNGAAVPMILAMTGDYGCAGDTRGKCKKTCR